MKLTSFGLAGLATFVMASSAFAQTSFPEVEPNSLKSEATAVSGIVAGDTIDGTTTGTVSTLGSTLDTTADMFRVKTGALPLGIYKHRLTITTTGTAAHTGTIRGVTQTGTPGTGSTGGSATTIDAQVQSTATTTTPARFNQWYGFGKQEEIYYRVTGSTSTTAPYIATMSTSAVVPTAVPQAFESANPITITTIGQTTVDTSIHVYDGNLDGIPLYSNDDEGPNGPTLQSNLVRSYPPGTYYVALSGSLYTSWSFPAPGDDDYQVSLLLDFPGSLVRTASGLTTFDWDFKITGSNGSLNISNTLPANSPYDVAWFSFTVQAGAPPIITPPPANDLCANAISVGTSATVTGDISGALNDGAASCDPGGASSRDVWYTYTNNAAGLKLLSLDTCTTGFDTVLTVYGSCGGSELACSDDCAGPTPCTATTSCVSGIPVNPSQTVWIRISDKGIPGGAIFTLHIGTITPPPSNDDCNTPIVLGAPGTYPFDTSGATTGTQGQGATIPCTTLTSSVKQDLWYTYTPTMGGTVTITDCGTINAGSSSQDTKIVIYLGAGCPAAPTGFACGDDSTCGTSTLNTILNFPVTCGSVYTIQFGNYGAGNSIFGTFTLSETGPGCSTAYTPYCSGDGSDTACPCSNPGLAGRGCENTVSSGGALLTSSGIASVASPTLVLNSTFAVPFGPGLYYEGNATALPGPQFGATFGNGLRCAGGATNRLEIRFADGTGAANTTVDLQAFGAAVASTTYYYQQWYRDTGSVGTCTPGAGFNLSNAISLTWAP